MAIVRSFVYLDEQKLYSYSSQIFEGLTEYIVNTRTKGREESDSGPSVQGQILANIFREQSSTEEKKFLFDHAYKLLEDRLVADGAVLDISCGSSDAIGLEGYDFVRVRGPLAFNDVRITKNFVSQINVIGEALTYVTNYKAITEAKEEAARQAAERKDRNKKVAAHANIAGGLAKMAEKSGLHFDQKFVQHLTTLLDFGFEDQFEVRMQVGAEEEACSAVSAILKRECLRETESMVVRKYGRKTEREFTLFGVVVQSGAQPPSGADALFGAEAADSDNVRAKLIKLVDHFVLMDNAMSGRSWNEVFVDPIALYLDVRTGVSNGR